MNKEKRARVLKELYEYLNTKYGASLEEVKQASEELGLVKGRLDAFFLVKAHQQKKTGKSSAEKPGK